MTDGSRVTDVDGVPADDTFLFTVREVASGEEREAILVRAGGSRTDADGAGSSDAVASDADASHGVDADALGRDDEDALGRDDEDAPGRDDEDAPGRDDEDAPGRDDDDAGASDGADGVPCVRAWLNYCRHLTHVRLDKGTGAPIRDGEIVCTNHGAMFAVDSGRCTFGPCEGAYLESLAVTVADGAVHLTDDGYEFVEPGPADTGDGDLTSTSNVEF